MASHDQSQRARGSDLLGLQTYMRHHLPGHISQTILNRTYDISDGGRPRMSQHEPHTLYCTLKWIRGVGDHLPPIMLLVNLADVHRVVVHVCHDLRDSGGWESVEYGMLHQLGEREICRLFQLRGSLNRYVAHWGYVQIPIVMQRVVSRQLPTVGSCCICGQLVDDSPCPCCTFSWGVSACSFPDHRLPHS